jgi:WD40 repeat protein
VIAISFERRLSPATGLDGQRYEHVCTLRISERQLAVRNVVTGSVSDQTNSVLSVARSPDGRSLASARRDKTIRLLLNQVR